jgi:hypothetical protein
LTGYTLAQKERFIKRKSLRFWKMIVYIGCHSSASGMKVPPLTRYEEVVKLT